MCLRYLTEAVRLSWWFRNICALQLKFSIGLEFFIHIVTVVIYVVHILLVVWTVNSLPWCPFVEIPVRLYRSFRLNAITLSKLTNDRPQGQSGYLFAPPYGSISLGSRPHSSFRRIVARIRSTHLKHTKDPDFQAYISETPKSGQS